MTTVSNHTELSAALCEALQQDASAFVDALYDVEHIEEPSLREIVTQVREQTKSMFAHGRARLGGAKLAVDGQRREGNRYFTVVAVEGGPRLEIMVDDVYERGGNLHTRDMLRINEV